MLKLDQTGNPLVDRVLRVFLDAFNALYAAVIRPKKRITGRALTTTNTRVQHGLGHPVTGLLVTKANAGGVVYSDTADLDPNQYIQLKASVAGTYDLAIW